MKAPTTMSMTGGNTVAGLLKASNMKNLIIIVIMLTCISCNKHEPKMNVIGVWRVTHVSNNGNDYRSAMEYNWYLSFYPDSTFIYSLCYDDVNEYQIGHYTVKFNRISCDIPKTHPVTIDVLDLNVNRITIKMHQNTAIPVMYGIAEKQIK